MSLAESGTVPLHQRIRAEIEGMILSGQLRPGDRIPVEHELMARYGCARMTVNKALSALVEAGLIERRKRAGSFVSRPQIHMAALAIPDIKAEITGRGQVYRYELLSRGIIAATEGDPVRLGLPPGSRLLHLTCRHLADNVPFALEERWINLAAVPEAATADFATVPPGSWLLAHVPWHEAEHRIKAAAAGPHGAALALAEQSPCLVLERRTWRQGDGADGEPVTYVRQVFPGDGFDLIARFTGS